MADGLGKLQGSFYNSEAWVALSLLKLAYQSIPFHWVPYKEGNGASERFYKLPKVTQPIWGRAGHRPGMTPELPSW